MLQISQAAQLPAWQAQDLSSIPGTKQNKTKFKNLQTNPNHSLNHSEILLLLLT